eukprot:2139432-Prymnesium_polylepis.1
MQDGHDDEADLQYDDDGVPIALEVVLDGVLYRAKPKNNAALLTRYLEAYDSAPFRRARDARKRAKTLRGVSRRASIGRRRASRRARSLQSHVTITCGRAGRRASRRAATTSPLGPHEAMPTPDASGGRSCRLGRSESARIASRTRCVQSDERFARVAGGVAPTRAQDGRDAL